MEARRWLNKLGAAKSVLIRCPTKPILKRTNKTKQLQSMMKPVYLATDEIPSVRNSVFPEVPQLEQQKDIQPALRQKQ
jgi:hypothetical protein